MFEKIRERYMKRYVRDDQLDRYVALGVITAEQANEIRGITNNSSGGGGAKNLVFTIHPGRVEVGIYA